MGIKDAATSALLGYTTDGAFSIEVGLRSSEGIFFGFAEHFFVVGPQNYTHQYHYKISAKSTFGGASVSDFGNGIGAIRLGGEIHAYFESPVRSPVGPIGTVVNAGLDLAGLRNKAGYHDFFDLLYFIQFARDPGSGLTLNPSDTIGDPKANGARNLSLSVKNEGAADFENYQYVFNDYDTGRRYEVALAPDGFTTEQSEQDPFTWRWSLNLMAVREMTSELPLLLPALPTVTSAIGNAIALMDEVSFAVTGALQTASDIVGIVDDVRGLKDELTLSASAFVERSDVAIQSIRQTLGLARGKNDKLLELIQQYYLPNQDLDTAYTAPGANNTILARNQTFQDAITFEQALNLLNSALFREQNKIQSENTRYVAVPAGATTWEDVARALLNDVSRAGDLKQLNGVQAAKSTPRNLSKIRIPSTNSRGSVETGIISEQPKEFASEDVERSLFGTDLDLTESMGLRVDSTGDLAGVSGLDCLVENLLDRLSNVRGTIPMHPQWGAGVVPANLPDDYFGKAEAARTISNLLQDPGVSRAEITRIDINGDAIRHDVKVVPVGDSEQFTLSNTKPRQRSK